MTAGKEYLPSFRRFDYRLRPNKGAERRMLVEAFRCLNFFEPIKNYRYIGFGSTTFTDFILLHRALNITDMISIEKRTDYQARFDFNKPFDCVEIKYGNSGQILSELTWDKRVIIWLDYDGKLTASVMEDISYIASRALSGSVLITTVNSEGYKSKYDKSLSETNKDLRNQFENISGFPLPPSIEAKNLQGIEMAKTNRNLIEEKISVTLRDRNGLNSDDTKMHYRPLLNFVYKDNAQMVTVGGIFYQTKDESILAQCRFEDLEFYTSSSNELFHINLPVMTIRERHFIEQRLPKGACNEAIEIGMKQEEIENFARLHRYCPTFSEIELI